MSVNVKRVPVNRFLSQAYHDLQIPFHRNVRVSERRPAKFITSLKGKDRDVFRNGMWTHVGDQLFNFIFGVVNPRLVCVKLLDQI